MGELVRRKEGEGRKYNYISSKTLLHHIKIKTILSIQIKSQTISCLISLLSYDKRNIFENQNISKLLII